MLRDIPTPTYRRDYRPPDFYIEQVALCFELDPQTTVVRSRLHVRRGRSCTDIEVPLILHGESLELINVVLDGAELDKTAYHVGASGLTLPGMPGTFTLEITTHIHPHANTALEGLYVSNSMFCTQCEAEGFRRITYYLDRPDIMACFETTIIADKNRYPVLLSNGNLVDQGEQEDGRHWVKWKDPFPKPCYLFALVAGDLDCLQDQFQTVSGRDVSLKLYVEPGDLDKCTHAMASLKQAMRWDEQTFGLEYDLDIYMIVAVSHFNMGAMENKGLNIFNSAYVLARPETATDMDYANITAVIGHEYFHNWTGNRVTCRDWFQLSLKEGLTVFRDQEFSADMGSRAVKRINDVRALRSRQFSEDAGPMAHPVRPESYIEIDNFYTATVYEKGAELVRMIQTLVGVQGFRNGLRSYFDRHDGQAVTTDDFVQAMADANDFDLTQFKRWYEQAGTPRLHVEFAYSENKKILNVTFRQSCQPTPGQPDKIPFYFPVRMGLLDANGKDLALNLENGTIIDPDNPIVIHESTTVFHFIGVPEKPVPSILRGFSAPVILDMDLDNESLAFLFTHDSDSFNRWEAGQQLAVRLLQQMIKDIRNGGKPVTDNIYIDAVGRMLSDNNLDPALIAETLELPGEAYLTELSEEADPDAIHQARLVLRRVMAVQLSEQLYRAYKAYKVEGPYRFNVEDAGRRRLRNQALSLLMENIDDKILGLAMTQFHTADNMTDRIAALSSITNTECPQRKEALSGFYQAARGDALVIDKWFAIQARSRLPDTLDEVKRLMEHDDFELTNPNRARALIGSFCHQNLVRFHDAGGAGYRFLADQVITLDVINSQIAARLAGAFNRWRIYDANRQSLVKAELERVAGSPGLSKAVYEIVSKNLAG